MGKDVIIRGETYNGVGKVNLLTANGSANFYDVSGALCTITAEYDEVEEYDEVYTSDKTAQEVYDMLDSGLNPVFRFHNLLDDDAYIYASMTKLESTADGEELTLSSFQTGAMTAATANDVFTLTVHGEPPSVEKTESGSVIHILDALNKPAVSLIANIVPEQDFNGYGKPWGPGAGTNKFDKDHSINSTHTSSIATALSTYISTGQYATGYTTNATSISANAQYCTSFTPCTNGTTYTIKNLTSGSNLALIGFVDDTGTVVSHNTSWSNQAWTHAADLTEKYIMICAKVAELENVMIVEGSTMPVSPSPYSNICPISGYSSANVVVSPTQDAQDGTTYTVNFGSTCYGGSINVTSGILFKRPYYSSYNGEALAEPWVSSMDNYVEGTTPTTGAQVVDLGGTALIVNLTPTDIPLLLGENYVWTDTGDTTLTYLADGRVNSLTALNMLLGGMYEPSSDVTDREALQIIMGETE